MKNKFTKWFTMWSLAIVGLFILACIGIRFGTSNVLTEQVFTCPNVSNIDDLDFEMHPNDLITIQSIETKDNSVYMTLEATKKGSGQVLLKAYDQGESINSAFFYLQEDGFILDVSTGNFSNYRLNHICIMIMIIASALLLWAGYFKSKKDLGFSYQSIFCIGLAIWVSIISVILALGYIKNYNMLNVYVSIIQAPTSFALFTFPFIFIFGISLIVSNISLIRHEGFRFTNILATLLAVMMIGGFFVMFLIDTIPYQGSHFGAQLRDSFDAIRYSCYAILECFLIGAIICGTLAARKNPSYDKDYIVILGCMIKEDGTLYPLIRGRVDRAIQFYKEQFEKTGKKAIFIPSGGKGNDEPISEAEAMKNYLLEQGIEPEQIMIEDKSINTRQNMQFSKKLIGKDANVVFCTTNFHVFRSGIISRQVDFEADGMGSPTKWYFWPNAYVREVIGMLSYKWKSLILLFIPIAAFFTSIIFIFT